MLIVGQVGWGNLHPTRLTPDEQYTHISLWCLLSAPLLIGCDMDQVRRFHAESFEQRRGARARPGRAWQTGDVRFKNGDVRIYEKELEDGGPRWDFSISAASRPNWNSTSSRNSVFPADSIVRDLWRQKDRGDN
jgi:alpha-galactosidase